MSIIAFSERLKSNYNKNKCNHSKYLYLCTFIANLIIFCPLNDEEKLTKVSMIFLKIMKIVCDLILLRIAFFKTTTDFV